MIDHAYDNNLRFNTVRTNHGMVVEIFAHQRTGTQGKFAVVLPAELKIQTFDEMEPRERLPGPMLTFAPEDAQRLADSLFDAGFRPSDTTKAAAQLGATEKHLADMRALVQPAGMEWAHQRRSS